MAFIILIFLVAAAISSVAAYFSLVGLGSIFAATFWGVVIMAGSLEVGKIVATKWVHSNWRNPSAPWYFRTLLCFFIACLMAITSLGIYGYLSRGHLEQKAPLAGLEIQVAQLEQQVKQKQIENEQLQVRSGQISRITDKSLEASGRAALRAASSQKREAAEIQAKIEENNKVINDLTTKLVPLKMKTGDVQGELGVAKFIAEAMGWEPEKAIRIIISLIMAAFDPLALAMFIMGGISLREWQQKRDAKQGEQVIAVVPASVAIPVEEMIQPNTASEPITTEPYDGLVLDTAYDIQPYNLEKAQKEAVETQEFMDKWVEEIEAEHDTDLTISKEEFERLELEIQRLEADNADLTDKKERLRIREAQLAELIKELEIKMRDDRPAKQKILDMLEGNPEVLQDIIEVVEATKNTSTDI